MLLHAGFMPLLTGVRAGDVRVLQIREVVAYIYIYIAGSAPLKKENGITSLSPRNLQNADVSLCQTRTRN